MIEMGRGKKYAVIYNEMFSNGCIYILFNLNSWIYKIIHGSSEKA